MQVNTEVKHLQFFLRPCEAGPAAAGTSQDQPSPISRLHFELLVTSIFFDAEMNTLQSLNYKLFYSDYVISNWAE